jgi:ketosteroid isomerase-like protein
VPLSTDDREALRALRGAFADAANLRDLDRFAALFADGASWSIPDMQAKFDGRPAIRAGIEHMLGLWEFFIQTTHDGVVDGDGDRAWGRAYVSEIGRFLTGGSQLNYAVYDDRFVRTAEGWRFASRTYRFLYVDESALGGRSLPVPTLINEP